MVAKLMCTLDIKSYFNNHNYTYMYNIDKYFTACIVQQVKNTPCKGHQILKKDKSGFQIMTPLTSNYDPGVIKSTIYIG